MADVNESKKEIHWESDSTRDYEISLAANNFPVSLLLASQIGFSEALVFTVLKNKKETYIKAKARYDAGDSSGYDVFKIFDGKAYFPVSRSDLQDSSGLKKDKQNRILTSLNHSLLIKLKTETGNQSEVSRYISLDEHSELVYKNICEQALVNIKDKNQTLYNEIVPESARHKLWLYDNEIPERVVSNSVNAMSDKALHWLNRSLLVLYEKSEMVALYNYFVTLGFEHRSDTYGKIKLDFDGLMNRFSITKLTITKYISELEDYGLILTSSIRGKGTFVEPNFLGYKFLKLALQKGEEISQILKLKDMAQSAKDTHIKEVRAAYLKELKTLKAEAKSYEVKPLGVMDKRLSEAKQLLNKEYKIVFGNRIVSEPFDALVSVFADIEKAESIRVGSTTLKANDVAGLLDSITAQNLASFFLLFADKFKDIKNPRAYIETSLLNLATKNEPISQALIAKFSKLHDEEEYKKRHENDADKLLKTLTN